MLSLRNIKIHSENERASVHKLFDHLPINLIEFDSIGNCVYVNARFEKLLGIEFNKLKAPGWVQFIHHLDRVLFFEHWNKLSTHDLPFSLDIRFFNIDQKPIYLGIEIVKMKDDDGNLVSFTGHCTDKTAQYEIHEKLIKKTQKLNEFFDLSTDVFCIGEIDGRLKILNKAFFNIFGYEEIDVLDNYFFNFIHPEDLPRVAVEIEKMSKGISSIGFEHRFRRKDGQYRTMIWNANCDVLTGRVFATIRDITETKEKDENFKQIMQALSYSTILAITDKKGIIQEVNYNFVKISGYQKEELIGQNHRIVKSDYHPKEFFKEMWTKICSGQVWYGEIQNKTKYGRPYTVQTVITPIKDINGNIQKFMSIRFDVTKLKEQEHLLEEAEKVGKVGSWFLDIECKKMTWSKELFNIFEITDRTIPLSIEEYRDYIHPEDLDVVQRSFQDCIDRKTNGKIRYRIIPNGKVVWVEATREVRFDKLGNVYAMTGICKDITIQVENEDKLKLEHAISMRTAKFATLGEMAAGIAHEINNPLFIVNGMVKSLRKNRENADVFEEKINAIVTANNRIQKIVNDLKKFSQKGFEGKLHLRKINEVVEQSISLNARNLSFENVKFLSLISTTHKIMCDELEIEQVLMSLMRNSLFAIKNLKEKWIKINVYDEKEFVVLELIDSGLGIPKVYESQLFQPFFTTKNIGEGVGLGLSMIKGIIDSHSATIEYRLIDGHTAFVIKFPIPNVEKPTSL
jgi:PAS domain S-box-containing protein